MRAYNSPFVLYFSFLLCLMLSIVSWSLYRFTFFLISGSMSISCINSSISLFCCICFFCSFLLLKWSSCCISILLSLYSLLCLLIFFCLITRMTSVEECWWLSRLIAVRSKPSTILPCLNTSPKWLLIENVYQSLVLFTSICALFLRDKKCLDIEDMSVCCSSFPFLLQS